VKLLFDQNLSHTLLAKLCESYPESTHVRNLGMKTAIDAEIWAQAANRGFAIVTKDSDFYDRSILHGHPPKVIWLRLGNCSTDAVERLLQTRRNDVKSFLSDPEQACLVLFG